MGHKDVMVFAGRRVYGNCLEIQSVENLSTYPWNPLDLVGNPRGHGYLFLDGGWPRLNSEKAFGWRRKKKTRKQKAEIGKAREKQIPPLWSG